MIQCPTCKKDNLLVKVYSIEHLKCHRDSNGQLVSWDREASEYHSITEVICRECNCKGPAGTFGLPEDYFKQP